MAPAWLTARAAAAKAALGTLLTIYIVGTVHFVDNACENVEHILPQEIIGQELALTHLTEVLCQHMSQKQPIKPLVISVHGPPGVGKTYTHLWLARTLYNTQPSADLDCPGIHCRGYKVIYGMDYARDQAAARVDAVRHEVVSHLSAAPDALLVIEEYDKLDCAARGLWRQLLQHPERANITSHRAVILMESNLGMTELGDLLTQLGDRSKVTLEAAEQLLRDIVFDEWHKSGCEPYTDTLKLTSLIDVFLPYLPLGREHMPQLVELALQQRRHRLQQQHVRLEWQPEVVDFVVSQVYFEGEHPLDGAKVVESAMTRHVNRLIRKAAAGPECKAPHRCTLQLVMRNRTGLDILTTANTAPALGSRAQHSQAAPSKAAAAQQQQLQQQRHHHRVASTDEL